MSIHEAPKSYVPCHAITGRNPRQRCLMDVDHRGPHWTNTEDLPEGCECKGICLCDLKEPA